MGSLEGFSEPTRAWFASAFAAPTPAQVGGWEAIAGGDHTLIHAPTGSGKTLAAFLWGLDRLFVEPRPADRQRCRLLYVSPLKALAYDIDRNLRAPLSGIANAAGRMGIAVPHLDTAMRTGDTPADERRRMLRHPPDILITTPESLYLMLTSQVRDIFAPLEWVIVDEIHSVAGTKRGAHLALSLERLEELARAPQRIGLSATQRPLDEIGRFLAGGNLKKGTWRPRPVRIVDSPRDKELEIQVVVPVEDMARPATEPPPPGGADPAPSRRSIWPAMYPELLDLVMDHRSTIIFSNSRGLVERLAAELNALAGEEIAKAHHGSVSREQRTSIEDGLKKGTLRCVVATSSLELGIDMDAVDLVVLVESPTTVARGLQRVGRAGHQVGARSRARVFPKHRGDLLEAALVVDRMRKGLIEETRIPANPLDVLAQQIVAMVAVESWAVDALYAVVRRAAPFANLGRGPFEAVLDMLSGRYPSDEFAELRPRIVWDRVDGTLSARGNARILALTNPGTIPDRGLYRVVLPEGGRVGELDEEMVYESRVGDVFVLGSSSWQISEITRDRVVVVPAPAEPAAKLPFWKGDTVGRPLETGRALGAFVREIGALEPSEARLLLEHKYGLDRRAASNLAAYLAEEREATGTLPTDREIVLERFRDEIGDWRIVALSPFGARIHAPWALAASRAIRETRDVDVDAVWSDDGIILRFPDADDPPDPADLLLEPSDVEPLVIDEVGTNALFAARFREAAARALLLPRRRPGDRTPLWLQRRRATSLLAAARRYPSFPIVLETYREVLQEHFDLPALREVLGDVQSRRVRVTPVDVGGPSPFASSLTFDFIASYLYEVDAPPAERRAMALTVDHRLLSELLGEPELRELLDPDVVASVEEELQRLAPDRRVSGKDGVVDLLRVLGPLTTVEVAARTTEKEPQALLAVLQEERRVIQVSLGGEPKWAVIEDAARLRDALGAVPPPGVPQDLLQPVCDPLGDVVGRFARTHAPFTTAQAAGSLGLPVGIVGAALERLEERGRMTRGAFRPGGEGREWVDADVLRRLRRRSLAVLRRQVEAVAPEAFARFSSEWHGVGAGGRGAARLTEAIRRLQGAAIPASILENDVLASRLDYAPGLLDAMTASGEVVWVGRSPLGARDGKVALYFRDQVPLLAWDLATDRPEGERHERIRAHLQSRGASFFADLYATTGGGDPAEALGALWDLVWAGEVTNDTLAPLRAFVRGRAGRNPAGPPMLPSAATPHSGTGRWYLTAELQSSDSTPTTAAAARAAQMLDRHGIVVRDAVLAEGVPGGFAGLYPVFSAFEDAGRVRRGYFIEGLGGSQFAAPGAIDRLRASDGEAIDVLAATDPANLHGAALPWPDHPGGRPGRNAGAHVILEGGRLAAYVERSARRVLTFEGTDLDVVAAALDRLGTSGRIRRMVVGLIDGRPALDTALGRLLLESGFVVSYRGLAHR